LSSVIFGRATKKRTGEEFKNANKRQKAIGKSKQQIFQEIEIEK
jgi:hypothetical protein